jgi:hypothetical protein
LVDISQQKTVSATVSVNDEIFYNQNTGKNRKKIIETFSNMASGHIRFSPPPPQKKFQLSHTCVPARHKGTCST